MSKLPEQCGASGGPIITMTGKLIGIVSNCAEQTCRLDGRNVCSGQAARPLHALPVWAVDVINKES